MQTPQAGQPQMNIDLKNTEAITNSEDGVVFQQGFILRKVSKFVAGIYEDALLPIPVFFDPTTQKIVGQALHPDLREELAEYCV
jgi:hypothetical protein